MPDLKISQLTNGNPAQTNDQIPINRGGVNFSITAGSISALPPTTAGANEVVFVNAAGTSLDGVSGFTFDAATGSFSVPFVTATPAIDAPSGTFRRNSGSQTSNILNIQTEANAALASFDKDGQLQLGDAGSVKGVLKLSGNTSGTVTLQPAAAAGTYSLQLPTNMGAAGQYLKTDGVGVTSWDTVVTAAAGADTQVQFNDGGAFAGDAGMTYGKTTGQLSLTGKTIVANAPVLNLAQTWNNAAVNFTGALLNVTNTASGASSSLLDLQVGGSSVFNVTPSTSNPGLTITNASAATLFSVSDSLIIGTRTAQLTPAANTSALTVSSYSLSGANAQSLIDLAGTWNTTGTPTAIKLNVTNTASNAASLLADLQVGGTSRLAVRVDGNIGISTGTPTNILSFGGNAARTVWMERHTTANTAGNNLTVQAGGATSGATDKNGGNLVLSSGTATGSGSSIITLLTAAAGGAGTTDRSPAEAVRVDGLANVGVGTTTFGTSAAKVLAIGSGTEPSSGPADTVQFYSVDRSAGNTIPAIYCEGSGVTNAGITDVTVTNKIAMKVNGTVYYLLATTVAT